MGLRLMRSFDPPRPTNVPSLETRSQWSLRMLGVINDLAPMILMLVNQPSGPPAAVHPYQPRFGQRHPLERIAQALGYIATAYRQSIITFNCW